MAELPSPSAGIALREAWRIARGNLRTDPEILGWLEARTAARGGEATMGGVPSANLPPVPETSDAGATAVGAAAVEFWLAVDAAALRQGAPTPQTRGRGLAIAAVGRAAGALEAPPLLLTASADEHRVWSAAFPGMRAQPLGGLAARGAENGAESRAVSRRTTVFVVGIGAPFLGAAEPLRDLLAALLLPVSRVVLLVAWPPGELGPRTAARNHAHLLQRRLPGIGPLARLYAPSPRDADPAAAAAPCEEDGTGVVWRWLDPPPASP